MKYIYPIFFFLITFGCQSQTEKNQIMANETISKDTIIYIGDPMCSWCWGIAHELQKLRDHYKNQYEFELIVGGLRPGGGEEWNDKFKDFLRHHWEDVNKASGQPFSFNILESDYFNYDTEPACRAVRVVRDLDSEKEFDFFKAVQYGFYVENKDPKETVFYQPICEKLNLPFDKFSQKFESEAYKQKTYSDFNRSAQMGVRSFPTVILVKEGKVTPLAFGFSTFEKMKNQIEN